MSSILYKKKYIKLLFFILSFFCFTNISIAQYDVGEFYPTCIPGAGSITVQEDANGLIHDFYTQANEELGVGITPEYKQKIINSSPEQQKQWKDAMSACGEVKTVPALELKEKPSAELTFTPEVGFPGFTKTITVDGSFFGNFIAALLRYTIYISGIFAVIMIMLAGFQWVSSGGNQTQIGISKKRLIDSLMGFFLCISCVLILGTINPDLINIRALQLKYIEKWDMGGDTPDTFVGGLQNQQGYPYQCPANTVSGMYNALNGNTSYFLGAKYTWAGNASPGVRCGKPYCLDCSGLADFVRYCVGLSSLNESGGTSGIFQNGILIKRGDTAYSLGLRPGDLVGWYPTPNKNYGHVLIYLGNNKLFDSHGIGHANPRTKNSIGLYDFDEYVSQRIGRIKYRKR